VLTSAASIPHILSDSLHCGRVARREGLRRACLRCQRGFRCQRVIPPSLVNSRHQRTVSCFTRSVLRDLDSYGSQPGLPTCARPLPVLGQCRQSSTYRVGMEVLGQERGPSRVLARWDRNPRPAAGNAAEAVRLRSKTLIVSHPALVVRQTSHCPTVYPRAGQHARPSTPFAKPRGAPPDRNTLFRSQCRPSPCGTDAG